MSTEISSPWWSEVEHLRPQRESSGFVAARPAVERDSATESVREQSRHLPIVRRPGAPKARALVEQRRSRGSHSLAPKTSLTLRRPDRIAAWAVLLGLVLVLTAAASAGASSVHRLGDRTLKTPMNGHDVRALQAKLHHLHLLTVPPTGHFGSLTYAAVRRFQHSRCMTTDGIAGPATISALKASKRACSSKKPSGGGRGNGGGGGATRTRVVTWYGPGWYGRRTACGNTLTNHLMGVAHKTLPCGTVVHFRYGGNRVTAKVVDRGPYAAGVDYDLTWAAARKLGVISIGRATVRASR